MRSFLENLADKVRKNEPIPPWLAAVLSAVIPIYRLGMIARHARPSIEVDARVVSFGNLTAGGTGKTPAVIERARAEVARGAKVAVLTRGYGAVSREQCLVVDGHTPRRRLHALIGDEPALILRKVPDIVLIKGADRVRAARLAVARGCDTLLLDDGYQYVRLARRENILVIDATNPFGNGRLIPRGILREPLRAAGRATHILLTRCDQAADVDAVVALIRPYAPTTPIRRTRHAPRALWRVTDGKPLALRELAGTRIRAVCGIGHPEAFFRTLELLGAVIVERAAYPDHASIPAEAFASALPIVTTEKDAVRLNDPAQLIYALPVELEDWP